MKKFTPKPIKQQTMVSNCCGAGFMVSINNKNERRVECYGCHKDCEPMELKEAKEKKIIIDDY